MVLEELILRCRIGWAHVGLELRAMAGVHGGFLFFWVDTEQWTMDAVNVGLFGFYIKKMK